MIYYTNYLSTIGKLAIASDGESLIGLWIEGQKYFENTIVGEKRQKDDLKILVQTKRWLDRYFDGEKPSSKELLLKPTGGEFRQIVWKTLLEIPYGKTTTYGEITKKVAKIQNKETMSAQAIGGAIGHNPISIIIPCHRVIGKKGMLVGYAGGIEIKKKLLEIEGVNFDKIKT